MKVKDENLVKKTAGVITDSSLEAADLLHGAVLETSSTVNRYVAPLRQSVFTRYPILFSGLVTLGAAATLLGLEQVLLKFEILQKFPLLILLVGLGLLLFTGKLYSKLD